MTIEEVKQKLINDIIDELKEKNINYNEGWETGNKLDIPFMIAPFFQVESIKLLEPLLEDLKEHTDWDLYYEQDNNNGYYTNGKIIIQLEKNYYELTQDELEMKEMNDYACFPTNYTYEIEFNWDERDWGYCECTEDMKDYDARYKCCGHGCDWDAPSISIYKIESLGDYLWEGDQHNYWKFKDKFNHVDEVKKKEEQKQAKIKSIKNQITYLEKELQELDK